MLGQMLINLIVGMAARNLKSFVVSAALFARHTLEGHVPISLAPLRHKDVQRCPAGFQRR